MCRAHVFGPGFVQLQEAVLQVLQEVIPQLDQQRLLNEPNLAQQLLDEIIMRLPPPGLDPRLGAPMPHPIEDDLFDEEDDDEEEGMPGWGHGMHHAPVARRHEQHQQHQGRLGHELLQPAPGAAPPGWGRSSLQTSQGPVSPGGQVRSWLKDASDAVYRGGRTLFYVVPVKPDDPQWVVSAFDNEHWIEEERQAAEAAAAAAAADIAAEAADAEAAAEGAAAGGAVMSA